MTARTCTVANKIVLPDRSPYRPTNVSIRLNVTGFTDNGATEVVRTTYAPVAPDGTWTATLTINDDIDPSGTSYSVRETAGQLWTIQLTAAHAGLTVPLRSVLVANPTNPNPLSAGVLPFTISNTPTAVGQVLVVTSLAPLTLAYVTPTGGSTGGGSTPSPNLTFGSGVYGAGAYSPAA